MKKALLAKSAQFVFGALLSATGSRGGAAMIARWILEGIRLVIVRLGDDPDVTYRIGGRPLRLPLSHELPFYRLAFPEYSNNVGRIVKIVLQRYADLVMIDVGANVGDTVALIRDVVAIPILCIEGDPRFFGYLKDNVGTLPDVRLEQVFLGQEIADVPGVVVPARGSARLEPGRSGVVGTTTLTAVIGRNAAFAHAKMLKIDTDGMDAAILLGASAFVAQVRPVIFFEYDPDLAQRAGVDLGRAMAMLRDRGYRHAMVYENTGDYVGTLDLQIPESVEDLASFYGGRNGSRYADLCMFHEEDEALWRMVRRGEIAHFTQARTSASSR